MIDDVPVVRPLNVWLGELLSRTVRDKKSRADIRACHTRPPTKQRGLCSPVLELSAVITCCRNIPCAVQAKCRNRACGRCVTREAEQAARTGYIDWAIGGGGSAGRALDGDSVQGLV